MSRMKRTGWAKKAVVALATTALAVGLTGAVASSASATGHWEWRVADVVGSLNYCQAEANAIRAGGTPSACVDNNDGTYYVYAAVYIDDGFLCC